MKFLKQLICKHKFEFYKITFDEESNITLPHKKIEKCRFCEKIKYSPMSVDDWNNHRRPKYLVSRYLISNDEIMEVYNYETYANYHDIVMDYKEVGYTETRGDLICKINNNNSLYYLINIKKIK